jgi:hypothetical protein
MFEWGGMIPDGDAASIPDNRFRLLINARLRNGSIVPRGGSAEFLDLGGTTTVLGLTDFPLGTRRSLWVVGDGCPGLSSSTGFYMGFYDEEQDPEFQSAIYYNAGVQGLVLGVHGGELYVGQDNVLRKILLISAPYGETALAVSGSSQDIPLLTFTGFTKITDLKSFGGFLFITLDGGAGTSKVVAWDGTTYYDSDLTTLPIPSALGLYRELLICGFAVAGTTTIRSRAVGVSPGTWTTYTIGAGTCLMRGPGAGVTYKDVFYWATGGDTICSFNGTTISSIAAGTTGIGASSLTHSCCVAFGYLFVSYTTSGGAVRIARFDGTTWVGAHKNLTTQFTGLNQARGIVEYRGDLWVGAVHTTGGGKLYRSPGNATTGTWVEIVPAVSANGDVDQLLVY